MVYGPCGGVRDHAQCEVDSRPCPFVETPSARWPTESIDRDVDGEGAPDGTVVMCDVRPSDPTIAGTRATARLYADWAGIVLLGDHHDTVDLPAVMVAAILRDEGVAPWVTLSCRDRNGVALEADLAALAELEVAGVHCVTGDARAAHVRSSTTPVFDLDSLRLTAMATSFGLTVSVTENPTVEPIGQRPSRLLDKFRAGADWCIINMGASERTTADFITAARSLGAGTRFISCIPVYTDQAGADRLARLPGVSLDPDLVREVLTADDPVEAGIMAAARQARRHLDLPGVEGINLSGPASTRTPSERAAVMRAVTELLQL